MRRASEIESNPELGEPRAQRPVVHTEVRAAQDRLCPRIGVCIVGVQEIEDVEHELHARPPRQGHGLRGTEVPHEPGRLMRGKSRQQLSVDGRPATASRS